MQGPIIDFILITGQGSGGSRCDALVSNDGASICHDICRYDGIHCAAHSTKAYQPRLRGLFLVAARPTTVCLTGFSGPASATSTSPG